MIAQLNAASDVATYGGKAASLAAMLQSGIHIPPGFVISADTTISAESESEVISQFKKLDSPLVAVRSSAIAEDGNQTSWAGQLETVLNVNEAGLITAIKQCQQSAQSDRAKAYANQNNLPAGEVAVIIQAMVQSEVSGVAFSVHPVTQDKQQLVIEAVYGLGEALVSGIITPDAYIVSKPSTVIENYSSEQTKQLVLDGKAGTGWKEVSSEKATRPKLSNEQTEQLSSLIVKLESFYGFPIDVEWALKDEQFYILQSRPITTLWLFDGSLEFQI